MVEILAAVLLIVIAPLFILGVAIGTDRYEEDEYWAEVARKKEERK